jgi:hypothetical protein
MVASDEIAPLRCDVVWKFAGKKLRLMADDTNDNVTPIDTARANRRAS